MSETILVTGCAGFIGFYVSKRLLLEGYKVIGIDNINNYYDIELKNKRLSILLEKKNFVFYKVDISEKLQLESIFENHKIDYCINLAAQAGVRYSLENPESYIKSNVIGFYNILEACKKYPLKHLVYASSSSVYGSNQEVPFRESDFVDKPVSLYAATKKSNELMAYSYSHTYKIPITGLRFFTVYGPMGRPDMAYFSFTDSFFNNEDIKIYNDGDFKKDLYRDFTYIDDIVEALYKILKLPPTNLNPMHNVFNLGNSAPEKLMNFIKTLEKCLSKSLNKKVEFKKTYEPIKIGDVKKTYASTDKLRSYIGFVPETKIFQGLQKFTDWYVDYYKKIK